jgi:hypothetical protein
LLFPEESDTWLLVHVIFVLNSACSSPRMTCLATSVPVVPVHIHTQIHMALESPLFYQNLVNSIPAMSVIAYCMAGYGMQLAHRIGLFRLLRLG